MGAWGPGVFENDDALDFLDELHQHGPTLIKKEIGKVAALRAKDYLDAPLASRALAAAESIVAGMGRPSLFPGDSVAMLREVKDTWTEEDLSQAAQAVRRIQSNSELADLWREAANDDFNSWNSEVERILYRLAPT